MVRCTSYEAPHYAVLFSLPPSNKWIKVFPKPTAIRACYQVRSPLSLFKAVNCVFHKAFVFVNTSGWCVLPKHHPSNAY